MSFPRYPAYKPSGVEWLGEVPEHWEVKPLKRVAEIQTGLAKGKEVELEGSVEVPFLRVANVQDNFLDLENVHMITIQESSLSRYLLRPGDVLMNEGGDFDKLGRGCIWDGVINPCIHQNHVFAVRPHSIRPSWLNAYTSSKQANSYFISRSKQSTNLASISSSNLMDLPVPIAPNSETEEILGFLDRETAKIDALIAEQQRLIELLQEKRQAVISHAVTKGLNPNAPMKNSGVEWLGEIPEYWEVAQLKYFSKSLPGFAFPSDGFVDDEGNWKLLRGVNVGVSSIRWDDAVYWERAPGDGLDRYELSPGDLVVGLDRPLIKEGLRVARIKPEDCPCMLLQRVAAVKGVEALSTDYLFYLLSSPFFAAHFEPETTGVSVPHISTGQIDSFVVPIPPPGEQAETVRFLSDELADIQRLVDESKKSSEILQERRSALISAAVTGQIDVRGLVEAGADER